MFPDFIVLDAPDFSSYYPEQTFELEEYMAMKVLSHSY